MHLALLFLAESILFSGYSSLCEKGCLRCEASGKQCLFCDLPFGFVSNNGTCTQMNPKGCLKIDSKGNCLACDSKTILDTTTATCVELLTTQTILNCVSYALDYYCAACSPGFYVQNGLCVPVPLVIRGCNLYSSDGKACDHCQENLLRSPTGERCESVSQSPTCLKHNYIACYGCISDHIYNQNYYRSDFFNFALNNTDNSPFKYKGLSPVESFWTDVRLAERSSIFLAPCQPTRVENCEVFIDAFNCEKCLPGFYKNAQKSCSLMPQKKIPHCLEYNSAIICSLCENKYFLSNDYVCIEVNEITNCIEYDGRAFISSCLRCEESMYVFQNNCVLRSIKSIDNCEILKPNGEGCEVCKVGFLVTSDHLKCLKELDFCEKYDISSASSNDFTCLQCNSAYALETNVCKKGEKTNCSVHSKVNECSLCASNYYLSNSNCVAHKVIELCDIYDSIKADTCTSCQNHALYFNYLTYCLPLNLTNNCETFSDYQTCTSCKLGYYLNANNCVQIPLDENCAKRDPVSALCILCNQNYYIVNGVCKRHFIFQTMNCLQLAGSGVTPNFECASCRNYNYIYDYNGEPVCLNSTEVSTPFIADCQIHIFSATATPPSIICELCVSGKILANDQKSCLSACPDGIPIILESQVSGFNVIGPRCAATASTTIAEYYELNGVTYIYKCTSTAVSHYTTDVQPLTFKKEANSIKKIFSYGLYRNQLFCDAPPSIASITTYFPGGATKDANCDLWIKSGSRYYCKRCLMGKTGDVGTDSTVTPAEYYLNCGTVIKGCDADIFYGGLEKNSIGDFKLSTIFSCHSCYRNDTIPVAFVTSSGRPAPFDLTANIPTAGTTLTGSVIQCLQPNKEDLGIVPDRFLAMVPANCGLLVVFTDLEKNFLDLISPSTSLRCVECKPGFRVIREGSYVKQCVPIDHCDLSAPEKIISRCSLCKQTYTLLLRKVGVSLELSQEYCVPKEDNQCFLTKDSVCYICKPGFVLNLDGICEKLVSPMCKSDAYSKVTKSLLTDFTLFLNQLEVQQWVLENPLGCRECINNFQPVIYDSVGRSMKACTMSPYVEEGNFPVATYYIPNCRNYGVYCYSCEPGYVISTDSLKCVAESAYPFCSLVNFATKSCQSCKQGYVLVREFCEKPKIPYCLEFNTGSDYQICKKCESGYILFMNTCIQGSIQNCQDFNYDGRCLACVPGHILLSIKGTQYCMLLHKNLNCLAVDDTKATVENLLVCKSCPAGFGLTTIANPVPICLKLNPIEGCITYDNTNTLITSTFTCLKCNSTFFLEHAWSCKLRHNKTPNCKTYSETNDFCSECIAGHYLANDRECKAYPMGVWGCVNYSSDDTCIQCESGKFLQNNQCIRVEESQVIENCLEYQSLTVCARCLMSYYLQNNTCIPSEAMNCEVYDHISSCKSCGKGYGLKIRDTQNIKDCVPIDNPYCVEASPNYPFNCLVCQNFYYINDGRCFAVLKFIENCEKYKTESQCKACKPGFILSQDGFYCLRSESFYIYNSSCSDLRYLKEPICTVCGLGHYFSSTTGECLACLNGIKNGCAFCSLNDTKKCEMCSTGWFDNNGTCVQWYFPPGSSNSTANTTNDTKSVGIFKVLEWAVILLLILSN